jgi:intermembrane space import and assembly protein 40
MATGPCGVEFREAFSCFHYSEAEPKGSDCYDTFKTMQDCMQQYPTVYNQNLDKDEGGDLGIDLGLDDDDEKDALGSSDYADGEEEAKSIQKEVEVAKK